MKKLVIHQERVADPEAFAELCPFGALEVTALGVEANAACKMCGVCADSAPNGEAEIVEAPDAGPIDKSAWSGVCVYADHEGGELHPVAFELLGKARQLAGKVGQKVTALLVGREALAGELLRYGADEAHVYVGPGLDGFRIEPYAACFADFIERERPCAVLVGATQVGRQLAPRVAARFRTGLTADCTGLDIQEDTDLIQTRPAFGGNIMAEIETTRRRPQLATVRYKVMDAPKRSDAPQGRIIRHEAEAAWLESGMELLGAARKERAKTIESAEVLVAAGRGFKSKEDVALARRLADALGGELACSRPLAENGWVEARRQVGLSGRTVRPKLFVACGVSGAVQFLAGMGGAERIVAINKDRGAPIFKAAHTCLVGDVYEVLPRLIEDVEAARAGKGGAPHGL